MKLFGINIDTEWSKSLTVWNSLNWSQLLCVFQLCLRALGKVDVAPFFLCGNTQSISTRLLPLELPPTMCWHFRNLEFPQSSKHANRNYWTIDFIIFWQWRFVRMVVACEQIVNVVLMCHMWALSVLCVCVQVELNLRCANGLEQILILILRSSLILVATRQ